MKKLNFEKLSPSEMKTITGGKRNGKVIGWRKDGNTCYLDIQWEDGKIDCDQVYPASACDIAL